jgi:nanoRNase/pAp phosphatase (c-di-AMP/oligoRNAs hydrolase)
MTKSNIQKRLDALIEIAKRGSRALILMHDNPDPDSLASALGLQYLLQELAHRPCVIAFAGIIGRAENRAMVKHLGIEMVPLDRVSWADYSAVAMVDTQPLTGNNSLPFDHFPSIIIDHHPVRPASRDVAYYEIRPDYNVTASIITEFVIASRLPLDVKLATALYYAIKSETQGLGREVGKIEANLRHYLYPLADQKILANIENARVTREYFNVIHSAMEHCQIYGDVVISQVDNVSHPDIVAEVADLFMRLEKARWSICFGTFHNDILISARTTDRKNDAGQVKRSAVGEWGAAGGHEMMAGAKIPLKASALARKRSIIQQITQHLLALTDAQNPQGEKLIEY